MLCCQTLFLSIKIDEKIKLPDDVKNGVKIHEQINFIYGSYLLSWHKINIDIQTVPKIFIFLTDISTSIITAKYFARSHSLHYAAFKRIRWPKNVQPLSPLLTLVSFTFFFVESPVPPPYQCSPAPDPQFKNTVPFTFFLQTPKEHIPAIKDLEAGILNDNFSALHG